VLFWGAKRLHGATRMTKDIDLLVAATDVAQALELEGNHDE
jgi:hypothetical protein